MSVLNYFKNTPGRPPRGRQTISVIFFPSNLQRGPWKKKRPVAPPRATGGPVATPLGRPVGGPAHGRGRGLSPPPRATVGACRPPRATGVSPLYKVQPPFPPHFSPKIPAKIQKKREG